MNRFDASQSLIGQRMISLFSSITKFTKDMKELELLFAMGQKAVSAIAEQAHRGIALKNL